MEMLNAWTSLITCTLINSANVFLRFRRNCISYFADFYKSTYLLICLSSVLFNFACALYSVKHSFHDVNNSHIWHTTIDEEKIRSAQNATHHSRAVSWRRFLWLTNTIFFFRRSQAECECISAFIIVYSLYYRIQFLCQFYQVISSTFASVYLTFLHSFQSLGHFNLLFINFRLGLVNSITSSFFANRNYFHWFFQRIFVHMRFSGYRFFQDEMKWNEKRRKKYGNS